MQLEQTSRFSVARLGGALLTLAATSLMLFGVRAASANDLSESPCTAGDVEIVGSGIVVNEPCVCPPGGTFAATVQFTVRNNTSSARYCVALHLVADGVVLTSPMDLVLRDANGSSTAAGKTGSERFHDTVMFASIPNFSCNTGLVCFGSPGDIKGKCLPGQCTTISWNTSPSAAGCTTADQNPPGGQCRHQQVCVIGYGATLTCVTNCGTTCSGSATLRACVLSPVNRGPFTIALSGSDGSSQTQSAFGDPSGVTCLDFDVTPGQAPATTYTLTVTDKDGCTRTATTSLDVRQSPTANAGPDQMICSAGATTSFTLAGTASNGTATWSIVSGPVSISDPSNLGSTGTFTGTGTATLRLTVTNPPCSPKTDDVVFTINALPAANAGADQAKCSAGATTPFTLAGVATNGTGVWSIVSGPMSIADPNALNSSVTFTGTGTATLRLTVTSNANPPCSAVTDDVVLTANGNPTAAAGPSQSTCSAGATTPFTLAGTASNGTPAWSIVSGPVSIANPSALNTGVTFTGTGTATLRLTVTSNANPPCPPATSDVVLTVRGNPTAAAGPSQSKCSAGATTPFTLAGTASNGTPAWSIVSGPVSIADPGALNTGVTFTGTGTATLRLTVTSNANPPCPPATSDVVLSVTATTVTLERSASPACNGVLVYRANVDGGSDCALDWTIDGKSLATFAAGGGRDDARVARIGVGGAMLEFRALDTACHTIAVSATCHSADGATCTGSTSAQVKQCVAAPGSCTPYTAAPRP